MAKLSATLQKPRLYGLDIPGPHRLAHYSIPRDPKGPEYYWCACGAEFERYGEWFAHQEASTPSRAWVRFSTASYGTQSM